MLLSPSSSSHLKFKIDSETATDELLLYSSICRVFTVIRLDQLKQVLQEGFNSISDTLIFSTNPIIVSSLYLSDGGSNFHPISFESSSTIQFFGEQKDYNSSTQPILNEDEMVLLKQAKQIAPLILLR